jgi:hypothetical protein
VLALVPALAWSQGAPSPAAAPAQDKKPEATPAAAPTPAPAQPPAQDKKPELPAREAYFKGMQKLLNGQGGSVQGVYTLALAAAKEQLEAIIEWDGALASGRIPQKRFQWQLPGFHMGTQDALMVIPDSRFFLELARQRGNEVDRRFFGLLDETFRGGMARIYVDPVTDVHACYHLGSREFISLYRGWTQFKPSAPAAYKATVDEEIQGMEQAMLTATCLCGTPEVVDAGFEAFLKTFPKSPIVPQVRERLQKLHTKTSDMLFRCGNELDVGQPLPYGVPTPRPSPSAPDTPNP